MTPGAHYRSKSTGSVYEVEKMGTSLADPCVLRLVGPSLLLEQSMRTMLVEPAWFEHAAVEVGKR